MYNNICSLRNIAGLCKGSTADSDSVCEGSNPSPAARKLSATAGSFSFFKTPGERDSNPHIVIPERLPRKGRASGDIKHPPTGRGAAWRSLLRSSRAGGAKKRLYRFSGTASFSYSRRLERTCHPRAVAAQAASEWGHHGSPRTAVRRSNPSPAARKLSATAGSFSFLFPLVEGGI